MGGISEENREGLYLFTPTVTADNSFWYRGTADAIWQNLDWLKQSHEPYVVIASGDGIYKMDYNKVLEYHIDKKADITIVCKEMPEGNRHEPLWSGENRSYGKNSGF